MSKTKNNQTDLNDDLIDSLSSVDNMIQYFKDKKYDYYCLLHTNNENIGDIINGISTDSNTNRRVPDFIQHCTASERREVKKFCIEHKDDLLLTTAQHLMIAVAWILPQEKRLFYLYPEVMFIDITSDTNKEKRPLFTITGRTATGTMFTMLRAFLPNQKTWTFRWLFSIVLSSSFNRRAMLRCKAMITDGDSQETGQLDIAISQFFPHVHRIRCGYHLNSKNWEKNGPKYGKYPPEQKNSCALQHKIISDWIYSWFKPKCETRLQYLASKFLLLQYLEQEHIVDDCGIDFINGVKKMIRENIEPNEHDYVYYLRKKVRHFAEYSNSAHEGTNHGLKYSADSVNPSHLLDVSTERLSFQGERTYEAFVNITKNQLEQFQSWNELPCADKLVTRAAALLLQEFNVSEKYEHKRLNKNLILIRYGNERKKKESPVAEFALTRKVRIHENTIKCSCSMFERDGLICRHLFYLFNIIKHNISHHDVDIRWWLVYAVYAFNLENGNDDLDSILKTLADKQIEGPNINISKFENIEIDEDISDDWIINDEEEVYCVNHEIRITKEDIMSVVGVPFGLEGLSQVSIEASDDESREYINSSIKIPDTAAQYKASKDPNKRVKPFSYLKDTFSVSCSTLEGLPYDYTKQFGDELNELHRKYKKIAFELNGGRSKGKIVSSSISDSRKLKHSGCNYLSKKKISVLMLN